MRRSSWVSLHDGNQVDQTLAELRQVRNRITKSILDLRQDLIVRQWLGRHADDLRDTCFNLAAGDSPRRVRGDFPGRKRQRAPVEVDQDQALKALGWTRQQPIRELIDQ